MLGGDAKRHPLAAAADQDRQPSERRGVQLLEPRPDARHCRAELLQPARRRAELVPILVVVALEPARADAEDGASAGDVIDRARHVGEQLGVAVAVAADQRTDGYALGHLGDGGEQRPALEVLARRVAEQRIEMIPGIEDVDPDLLGLQRGATDIGVVGVLWIQGKRDSNHEPAPSVVPCTCSHT